MFTRIGAAAFKKDLTNTWALCDVLNQPHTKFKSIHVAGTNGKGSTSHMLASILQEAGYKVGLYTSPHLRDFRERIKINGEMIPEQTVIDFVAQHKNVFDEIEPSFFEWTVALCFHYFAQQQVDVAIIETGLGGRLDSTNVITPQLSVITNIGWDHMDMLGDTLPKIAGEKAGIIKPNIPVVIGEFDAETFPVFQQKATEQQSALTLAAKEITLTKLVTRTQTDVYEFTRNATGERGLFECDLQGNYQLHNLKTVLASVNELQKIGYRISTEQVQQGLQHVKKNTGLMGRWQVLQQQPLVVADTGHNVNGLTYVLEQINQQQFTTLHMVIGMVRDKDITKVLAMLPKQAVYYFTNANIPRALPATELAELAQAVGLNGRVYESVAEAKAAALQQAQPTDMIFIGGSTFIVAEAV
jgi:dihydrofolate synthase/folylpolyglutamate synthase